MPREDTEDIPGGALPLCWRCAKGKSGSGGFLTLRSLEKRPVDFLGVVSGLWYEELW